MKKKYTLSERTLVLLLRGGIMDCLLWESKVDAQKSLIWPESNCRILKLKVFFGSCLCFIRFLKLI